MYAFLSSKNLIAVNSKSIIKINCRCHTWTSLCSRHNKRLSSYQPVLLNTLNIPCPIKSSRHFSTLLPNSSRPGAIYSVDAPVNENKNTLGRTLLHLSAYNSSNGPHISGLIFVRHLHAGSRLFDKEPLKPSSKLEGTVQAIKQDIKESEKPTETSVEKAPVVKKTLRQKIVHEILHYYHGFRLLFIDINVSSKLVWRVLNGNSLTRREHRLLVRTVSDLFRLLPFSVFIIVPFMELLLPLAIKMFPGMLPSTFQTATEKDDKMKQALKVKLEMAKFLQKTLDDMAVVGKGHRSDSAKEFAEFFVKLRTSGAQATNEEIMKFSKLFEDEITLDSLSRPQLTALCRVLEIQPLGTNNFLRFQLRMKLRSLAADDKVIEKEGIEMLTTSELQQACRARGMRAYGMSTDKLRAQLNQWLDLSLHQKVPPSLLLLSRALLLPESIPTSDMLKATISVLPDTVATQTKAAIGEREGKIDNKTKIEIIKEEQRLIKEEQLEQKEQLKKDIAVDDKELLVDKAPIITQSAAELLGPEIPVAKATGDAAAKKKELTSTDLETLEDALDTLGKDKKTLLVEKEELDDLKEELAEYKEDVDDLKQVMKTVDKTKTTEVHETKAAQRLYKKVNSMIGKMDAVLCELEQKEKHLKEDLETAAQLEEKEVSKTSQALVSIEELMTAIKQIQKVPDDSLVERISEVLQKMDDDRDGSIAVDDVLKVIELVGKENVKIGKKQLDEIIDLIGKEEKIELEGQIERVLAKETQQKDSAKQEKMKKLDGLEKELAAAKAMAMMNESQFSGSVKPPSSPTSSSQSMSAASPETPSTKADPQDPNDQSKTL